jgi:hypothetical protein
MELTVIAILHITRTGLTCNYVLVALNGSAFFPAVSNADKSTRTRAPPISYIIQTFSTLQ